MLQSVNKHLLTEFHIFLKSSVKDTCKLIFDSVCILSGMELQLFFSQRELLEVMCGSECALKITGCPLLGSKE